MGESKSMSIKVLVSTMNLKNYIHDQMNINSAIIINQSQNIIDQHSERIKYINVNESGLSKSRNLAIANCNSDISIITDDDVIFNDNYESIIKKAYKENPIADVIVFRVKRVGGRNKKYKNKSKKINKWTIMKVSSVEITFKTKKIKENHIKFNENFGAGSKFLMGEENLFLKDCLDRKLNIIYLPIEIATVDMSESSWFEGYNDSYLSAKGAVFKALYPKVWFIISLQFLIRKNNQFNVTVKNFWGKANLMRNGADLYKKGNY
ncbi:glycosyltransferase family A protein [Exiguobacterium sp. UBA3968]|uniref:glycosyltransferase family A protein n=1 Tax=Exiguobacterium sp. UBA3968 TaxID=1946492 RepID=UPI0025C5F6FA|nr:glycosyltransferase family A protein [Exiguobacterium sp. UBA3968]